MKRDLNILCMANLLIAVQISIYLTETIPYNHLLAVSVFNIMSLFLFSLMDTNRFKRKEHFRPPAEKIDDDKEKTIRIYLNERLHLLNRIIVSNMTPNPSNEASEEMTRLMQDKKHFIESTRISYVIEHPEFIRYLKNNGLSDSETGYCCLYAMGLKGKDISGYMGSGHYKLSSAIRKKLGLCEHDTNLDIFLHQILKETIS
ncbi:MAG: hypothetical protein IJ005_07440 [Bacteroidales bacterium]|nr:hypothetical protein [Bacteroidales bacterium]